MECTGVPAGIRPGRRASQTLPDLPRSRCRCPAPGHAVPHRVPGGLRRGSSAVACGASPKPPTTWSGGATCQLQWHTSPPKPVISSVWTGSLTHVPRKLTPNSCANCPAASPPSTAKDTGEDNREDDNRSAARALVRLVCRGPRAGGPDRRRLASGLRPAIRPVEGRARAAAQSDRPSRENGCRHGLADCSRPRPLIAAPAARSRRRARARPGDGLAAEAAPAAHALRRGAQRSGVARRPGAHALRDPTVAARGRPAPASPHRRGRRPGVLPCLRRVVVARGHRYQQRLVAHRPEVAGPPPRRPDGGPPARAARPQPGLAHLRRGAARDRPVGLDGPILIPAPVVDVGRRPSDRRAAGRTSPDANPRARTPRPRARVHRSGARGGLRQGRRADGTRRRDPPRVRAAKLGSTHGIRLGSGVRR
ncbi:hypothetical protein ARZXY2_1439 [Arthrobacter sp. ZXY-2]|nr:hypothetical protein ARZXY2_1439 [Arthrobacter sp. ZXY-2]